MSKTGSANQPIRLQPHLGAQMPDPDCAHCAIRPLAICAALRIDDLPQMERLVTHRQLEKGEPLFEENQSAEFVYTLSAGSMRLYKLLPDGRRQITGFALPGDFLGFAARDHYVYSAEAITPARLCRFRRTELSALCRQYPALEHRLLNMASAELAAAQDQMLLLGRKAPLEKVASFLASFSRRLQRLGESDHNIVLPMTRSDIADFLGLTIETVSRCFSRLKKAHAIVLPSPECVQIGDLERLTSIARGEAVCQG